MYQQTPVHEFLPYLSPVGEAIIREIWDPDSDNADMAFREDIEAAAVEADPDANPGNEISVLENWDVINESGFYSKKDADGKNVKHRRYFLSDNGYRLVEHPDFGKEQPPRSEWSVEDWVEYPAPIEQKFAELVEEFIALRDQIL